MDMGDPAVFSAICSILGALIGGLCVAVPSIYQSKQNSKLTAYRIEQLELSVKELNSKFDKHEEHSSQIAELRARLDAAEYHIQHILSN